ncbi:MAG TPA: 16S rRNA (guanine(527)-N(7))-methyltransferase RsmG [Leptolyngbyaceae cyanobacterium]
MLENSDRTWLPEMGETWQKTLSWQPNPAQQILFQRLYELICQGNQQLNLTRITDPMEFWEKHLWDSLVALKKWGIGNGESGMGIRNCRVIDIGTGAGFPGIPIGIIQPNWQVTLLDSTRKKIAFLETLVENLDIKNVTALCDRAEKIGQQSQHRESYDLALIRAVGTASECAEYALPLLKIGGLAILYRGQWTEDETTALRSPVTQLGGIIESVEKFTTPITNSIRHCLYIKKIASTPAKFPRPVGIPTQKPLQ